MALARDKVVRVEVVQGGVDSRESTLLSPTTPAGILPNKATDVDSWVSKHVDGKPISGDVEGNTDEALQVAVIEDDFDQDVENQNLENQDEAYPLPENWPRIPEIFQRRSWTFSTAVSPSVNKATSHLELLQNIIEEYFSETGSNGPSLAPSRALAAGGTMSVASVSSPAHTKTVASSGMGSKRQITFVHTPSAATPAHKSRLSAQTPMSTALSVQGYGANIPSEYDGDVPDAVYELPYLGAEEVLEEVITLLARLENDRAECKSALAKERRRVKMLSSKIDTLAVSRMTDLPASVQKEHEACANDINELNWHVNYRGRGESRIKHRAEIAEALNKRLKEDIDFVKSHCPLVEEKLELELSAMERIRLAQQDTDDELDITRARLAKVEAKSAEAHAKAEAERTHIRKDLDSVQQDLADISEDLSQAKMLHNTYIHKCNDYRQQLKDNNQEIMIQDVKNENAKTAESMQAAKVKDLESKIVTEEFEHRKLVEQNEALQADLDDKRHRYAAIVAELEEAEQKMQDKLRDITRKNQELEMDIEDATKKIKDCERQKTADEKNLSRMGREQEKTEEQMNLTMQELQDVTIINNAIREQLMNEEDRCRQAEDAVRSTVDAIKKQVKDEIHSRGVIQSRIKADTGEMDKVQGEAKIKKDKVQKMADEVTSVVTTVKAKVDKLRSAHKEKTEAINKMKWEMSDIDRQKREIQEWQEEKKKTVGPKHKALKEELTTYTKQIDHMDWKTELMEKKIEEMDASSGMMVKSIANTTKAINKLQETLDEESMQLEGCERIADDIKKALEQTNNRIYDLENNHRDMMKERRGVLEKHESDLESNIQLNKELASKYRALQNEYVVVKNQTLNLLDKRIRMEADIKDVKQLQGLQTRMHAAMVEYYKYRGLYNDAELNHLGKESNQNADKVSALQSKMDGAMAKITHFIKTQMDGNTARRDAMAKVRDQELAAERQAGAGRSRPPTAVAVV